MSMALLDPDRARHRSRSETRALRWAALGDSFTAGLGDGEVRWVDHAAAALAGGPRDVRVHNLAIPGATSAQVRARQLEPAIAIRPELVTLICGANDVVLAVRPDLEALERNVATMLDRLRAELPGTVVLTATYPDVTRFFPLRPRSRARVERGMREVNELVRGLSGAHGARCVELAGHPEEGNRENFASDGFHASPAGHRKAARAFVAAASAALRLDGELTEEEA